MVQVEEVMNILWLGAAHVAEQESPIRRLTWAYSFSSEPGLSNTMI